MKNQRFFMLSLCLLGMAAQAQTTYAIDQPLDGKITHLQVFGGWNVRLVNDTLNMVSILSPCEYYFGEGNEPQICRHDASGRLNIWQNRSMPKGTVVEVHLKRPLEELTLQPGATLEADTLLVGSDIKMQQRSRLAATFVQATSSSLTVEVDTAAVAHFGTLCSAGYVLLHTRHNATLNIDSLDCAEVNYKRSPSASDNLSLSDPSRHLTVKTRNRWLSDQDYNVYLNLNLRTITPFYNHLDSPYGSVFEIEYDLPAAYTTPFRFSSQSPLALRFGLNFTFHYSYLINDVKTHDHLLVLDNAANKHYSSLFYYSVSLPVSLLYMPNLKARYFDDIHLTLRPMFITYERLVNAGIDANNKSYVHSEHIRDFNHFQMRLELGITHSELYNIEIGLFADLLPTYRRGSLKEGTHLVGMYFNF